MEKRISATPKPADEEQKNDGGEPLFFPLTYDCNQHCVFCSSPNGRFAGETLADWLSALRSFSGKLLQLSGGEPLSRDSKSLLALLKHCSARGICVEFQTNGTLLAKLPPQTLRALVLLVGKNGGHFNVNFSSHTAALDAKITGHRGGFDARLTGVKALLALGAKVRLTHIITAANYKFLPEFSRFCARELKGIGWIQFSFAKATGAAAKRKIVPRYSVVAPYLNKALALADGGGLRFIVDYIPLCYLPAFAKHHIDWDKVPGKTQGPHSYEKKKPAVCTGCVFFSHCAGPRLDYLRLYPRFTPPKVLRGHTLPDSASKRQDKRP